MPLVNRSLEEFIMLLASKEPAPGGGSASALLGAIGSALSSMVANLTIGKEKFKEEDLLKEILEESENLQKEFLSLIEEDTNAFNKVSRAYKMPKDTEEQKLQRKEALERALKDATVIPLLIMEKALLGLKLTEKSLGSTNPNVISDIGVSVLCLKSALQGAYLNVLINLKYIKDSEFVREMREKAEEFLAQGLTISDEVYEKVKESLGG